MQEQPKIKITYAGREWTPDHFLVAWSHKGSDGSLEVGSSCFTPSNDATTNLVIGLAAFGILESFLKQEIVTPAVDAIKAATVTGSMLGDMLANAGDPRLRKACLDEKTGPGAQAASARTVLSILVNTFQTAFTTFKLFIKDHTTLGPLEMIDLGEMMGKEDAEKNGRHTS